MKLTRKQYKLLYRVKRNKPITDSDTETFRSLFETGYVLVDRKDDSSPYYIILTKLGRDAIAERRRTIWNGAGKLFVNVFAVLGAIAAILALFK